jgi:hypothetical protein
VHDVLLSADLLDVGLAAPVAPRRPFWQRR